MNWNDFLNPDYVQPGAPPTPTPPTRRPLAGTAAPTAVDPITALLGSLLAPRPTTQTNAIPWHELIQSTQPGYSDVHGEANKLTQLPSYVPGSASPFNTGFFDLNQSSFGLTPEAKLASQGPSAQTQWGLLGGLQGVHPDILRGLLNNTNSQQRVRMGSY